jgi:dihydroneopterin aldolase/2-amino-4-hydroxy-6-hydroxymethyldihydropteridine diphosphokinase
VSGAGPDRVEIRGLEVLALCGVLPEERERRQPFRFDLDLYLDLSAASASDALDDTTDYGDVCQRLVDVLSGERFSLLERLAGRAAEVALADPKVGEVTVTVHKLRPPVAAHLDRAGVRLHRGR